MCVTLPSVARYGLERAVSVLQLARHMPVLDPMVKCVGKGRAAGVSVIPLRAQARAFADNGALGA